VKILTNNMKGREKLKRILHIVLRSAFGICLFLSQFTSNRNTIFTDNFYLLFLGILFLTGGILLLIKASLHLRKAINAEDIVISGPFKYIRHPIYTSMYIFSIGLGLIFFAWLWFIVMIIFIPFWYLECREEEKEMIKLYGQKYIDYRKKTGMFLPRIR